MTKKEAIRQNTQEHTRGESRVLLADRIYDYGIAFTAERADSNPNMDPAWAADHYRCTLQIKRRRMTVPFSMCMGYGGTYPKLDEVLGSLLMDANGYENARSFEEWCSEYGYDSDSRQAERLYKAVERTTTKLHALVDQLGVCAWQNLLYHTEY